MMNDELPETSPAAMGASSPIHHSSFIILHSSFCSLVFLDELERCRVHAVTQAGRARAVVEDVAEVRGAAAAQHFLAHHAVAGVAPYLDVVFINRLVKARPAGAAIELGVRAEQLQAAADADVFALLVIVPVLAGESALGAVVSCDFVLLGRQLLAPLFIGLDYFVYHLPSFLFCMRLTLRNSCDGQRRDAGGKRQANHEFHHPTSPVIMVMP